MEDWIVWTIPERELEDQDQDLLGRDEDARMSTTNPNRTAAYLRWWAISFGLGDKKKY